jgi:magnesium-transporting ATPase (P-type)
MSIPQNTVAHGGLVEAVRWHSESATEVLEQLACDVRRGLSDEEAARRLDQFGPNALVTSERVGWPTV